MLNNNFLRLAVGVLALSAASACSDFGSKAKKPLPGDRVSVLAHESNLKPNESLTETQIRLPRPRINADWPQSGGYAHHAMHHLAIGGNLQKIWDTNIGVGNDDRNRLLNQPIVAEGLVYVMDANALVTALTLSDGREVWSVNLRPENEDEGESLMGGGVAYENGRIFATTGFGEVFALDAKNGAQLWNRALGSPLRASPTVNGGRVFVLTLDNAIQALSAADGAPLWTYSGAVEVAGLLGAASPALDAEVIVAGLSTGELMALRVGNGGVVWQDQLAARASTDAVSNIADIPARPVIDRGLVIAVGHGGLMVAIDLRTGARMWETEIGGMQQPWVAGDYVYVLTNNAELVALDRRTGGIIWVNALPRWEDEEAKDNPIVWNGPLLASDRLILPASTGMIYSVSPYTGKTLGVQEMSSGINLAPIIANGTVIFLTESADLVAYR